MIENVEYGRVEDLDFGPTPSQLAKLQKLVRLFPQQTRAILEDHTSKFIAPEPAPDPDPPTPKPSAKPKPAEPVRRFKGQRLYGRNTQIRPIIMRAMEDLGPNVEVSPRELSELVNERVASVTPTMYKLVELGFLKRGTKGGFVFSRSYF